jgi:hypothetical protein
MAQTFPERRGDWVFIREAAFFGFTHGISQKSSFRLIQGFLRANGRRNEAWWVRNAIQLGREQAELAEPENEGGGS